MSKPTVLVPITITEAMLTSSTAAEPSATETEWLSSTNYDIDQECIRASTHRVYRNKLGGVEHTPPENSPTRWENVRATNKWSMFDFQHASQTEVLTPLTVVLRPGLFNAIDIYGLSGASITITCKVSPGGSTYFTSTKVLQTAPVDEYDHDFGAIKQLQYASWSNIPPEQDPEVTITISSGGSTIVKCGVVAIGDRRNIITSSWGGAQYGAKVTPINSSYMMIDSAGKNVVKQRSIGTDLDFAIESDIADGQLILSTMQSVLGVPCSYQASTETGYNILAAFGTASANIEPTIYSTVLTSISVKGLY